MRRAISLLLLTLVLIAPLGVAPGAAAATRHVSHTYGVNVTCAAFTPRCTPPFVVRVRTAGLLQVEFTASIFHCTSIGVSFYVDGRFRDVGDVYVDAGQSTGVMSLGHVRSGRHRIEMFASDGPDGCAPPKWTGWSGELRVITSRTT